MTGAGEHDFKPKLGRIRARGGKRSQAYLNRIVAAMKRAGPGPSRGAGRNRRHAPGRTFARRVVVKARIVMLKGPGVAAQRLHLRYIQREAVGPDGEKGKLFDQASDQADGKAFLKRGAADRHHFRLIVSPEDGAEMRDLKAFTRDLMTAMEKDLDTRLDWVAAAHYDTGRPHVHIVIGGKREDGRDLVIPRKYISYGMRERASELVSIELGPQTEMEIRTKLAAEATQERLTRLDRQLADMAGEGALDLTTDCRGQAWRRRLHLVRLKKLERLGLAEKTGAMRWRLAPQWQATLKRMGERGDIIKSLNAKLAERGVSVPIGADAIYDPADPRSKSFEGGVLATGVAGENHDRTYAVIERTDGRVFHVDLGSAGGAPEVAQGAIARVAPMDVKSKPSDRTIAKIAAANGGRYSAALHLDYDKSARPEFIAAHVRRLEALRRDGHAERLSDGGWTVPDDYLARAENYERQRAKSAPVNVQILSRLSLSAQECAIGTTWLDRQLMSDGEKQKTFGAAFRDSLAARRLFLIEQGMMREGDKALDPSALKDLERRDLAAAGEALSKAIGKPYKPATSDDKIEGTYRQPIDRPSGRFAVIERTKDFTLVPWRNVLERNRGKTVAGMVRGQSMSWTLTRSKGIVRD